MSEPVSSPTSARPDETDRSAMRTATNAWQLSARTCPTKTPEEHLLGEFPMTCYRCHMEADS